MTATLDNQYKDNNHVLVCRQNTVLSTKVLVDLYNRFNLLAE